MRLWGLLRETVRRWRDDRATQQGAALSFYALFSIAPLLIVATAAMGIVFGTDRAERRLAVELRSLLTPEVAHTVEALVHDASTSRSGIAAGSFGLLISLYGASRGFLHLQATMNSVWEVRAIRGPGLLELVRRKLLTFASAAVCGLLLLVSLMATIVFHAATERATAHVAVHWVWLRISEELSTFVVVSVLLMIVYKTLPDAAIRWRDTLVGASVSATLFVLGKHAIAYYMRHAGLSSTFGAAGAIAAVLVYVQYMAQVLLFGAQFTFVFARSSGRPIVPKAGAARVVRTTVRDDPDLDVRA